MVGEGRFTSSPRVAISRGNLFNCFFDWNHVPTGRVFQLSRRRHRNTLLAIMGPFGSGKSSTCVMAIMGRGRDQDPGPDGIRRSRFAIIRNTYRQLEDTTIATFFRWFPPMFCGRYNKTSHTYTITCFPGCEIEILFRALDRPDHVANLLSLELTAAWVNEAREVPWSLIEALLLRTNRYPPRDHGGATYPGVILDTNPPDDESDFYRMFETVAPGLPPDKRGMIQLFRQPPGLRVKVRRDGTYQVLGTNPKAENIENLPPGYYVDGAIGKGTEFIKVFLLGEYGFAQMGKPVFPEYSDHLNYDAELEVVPRVKIIRGWDFGLTPACVFHQFLPAPRLLVIDELCATRMGLERFAEEVATYCAATYPGYSFEDIGDPSGLDPVQTDERTCFQILEAKGFHPRPGAVSLRLRVESARYGLRVTSQGMAAIILGPKCRILRRAYMGGYHYRRLKLNIEKYAPKPEKDMYSHPIDAHMYVTAQIFGQLVSQRPMDPSTKPLDSELPGFMQE